MGTVVLQQAVAHVVAFQQTAGGAPGSPSWLEYAGDLLRMVFALGFVCVIAWITLRFAASRGLGTNARGKRLEVIERLTLDPQRSLLIVRVDQRRLLIGIGAGAAPQLMTELDASGGPSTGVADVSAEELARVRDAVRRDATH